MFRENCSWSFTTNSTGKLHVFGHNSDSLGVDGAKVGVLEEANQESLRGLLEGKDGRWLEAQIGLDLWSDLTYESLEGQFPNEKFSALLELTDFTQGNSTRPESVRLLHLRSQHALYVFRVMFLSICWVDNLWLVANCISNIGVTCVRAWNSSLVMTRSRSARNRFFSCCFFCSAHLYDYFNKIK